MKCVHLDFHTSPDIAHVGARFNKKAFAETVRAAHIDLMTVFAKCHHGYTYYPSRVGVMHPQLSFDLLGEQLDAIHEAGAKAPIYITMGWSKKDADEHPEWHQIDPKTGEPPYAGAHPSTLTDPDTPLKDCTWTPLCPLGGYREHLIALTREVCERYAPVDGIFYDICFIGTACVCEACRAGMRRRGMDPDRLEDAERYYTEERIALMQQLTGIVHEYVKDAPVFYNGGAHMDRTAYHPYQTHYELEDLPTAWGGYDLMPVRAKFFEKYGKPFLGMTGKFHHAWGEFGGFKYKEALRYECADMLSVGASISVGDQLHPEGALDESTYRVIGHAFDYVRRIERFCEGTHAYTDLALWLSHHSPSDMGASKLLQTLHLEYDVVGEGDGLSGYRCIILPDRVHLSDAATEALRAFVARGGTLIASYESIPAGLGIEPVSPSYADLDYIACPVGDYTTPFLSYSHAYRVKAEGEWLARVHEPYFNRTAGRFCGHKNTPYQPMCADYPAAARVGGVLYLAHPVFEAYNASGSYVLEQYIAAMLDRVYRRATVTEELPSCGRLRLRESDDGSFLALHVLYAPPVSRGNVCLLPDFPCLCGVRVTLHTAREVTSATLEPDGTPVPFTQDGDTVTLMLPPFRLHALVVLK